VVDRYFGAMAVPAARGSGWEPADFPHGTLLMARRDCLREIGLFDERYFAYCEEADLGVRARRAGWEVGVVWGAVVHNPDWGSAKVADYLMLRNSLLFIRTHSGSYPALVRFVMAIGQAVMTAARPAHQRPPQFRLAGRALALLDFARARYGAPPAVLGDRIP
jgi:GT2 family glycosyltransferase